MRLAMPSLAPHCRPSWPITKKILLRSQSWWQARLRWCVISSRGWWRWSNGLTNMRRCLPIRRQSCCAPYAVLNTLSCILSVIVVNCLCSRQRCWRCFVGRVSRQSWSTCVPGARLPCILKEPGQQWTTCVELNVFVYPSSPIVWWCSWNILWHAMWFVLSSQRVPCVNPLTLPLGSLLS